MLTTPRIIHPMVSLWAISYANRASRTVAACYWCLKPRSPTHIRFHLANSSLDRHLVRSSHRAGVSLFSALTSVLSTPTSTLA
jgi:hypothetical protein